MQRFVLAGVLYTCRYKLVVKDREGDANRCRVLTLQVEYAEQGN